MNLNFNVKTTKDTVSILKSHIGAVGNLIQIDIQGMKSDDGDSVQAWANRDEASEAQRPRERMN